MPTVTDEEKVEMVEKCLKTREGREKLSQSLFHPINNYLETKSLVRHIISVCVPIPPGGLFVYNISPEDYYSSGGASSPSICIGDAFRQVNEKTVMPLNIQLKQRYSRRITWNNRPDNLTEEFNKLYQQVAIGETNLFFKIVDHYLLNNPSASHFCEEFTEEIFGEMIDRVNAEKIIMGQKDWNGFVSSSSNFDINTHAQLFPLLGSYWAVQVYKKEIKDRIYFFPEYLKVGSLIEKAGDDTVSPAKPGTEPFEIVFSEMNANKTFELSIIHTYGMIVFPNLIRAMIIREKLKDVLKVRNKFNRYTALTKAEKWRN